MKPTLMTPICSVLIVLFAAACAGPPPAETGQPADGATVEERAQKLAQELLIVDTHIDVPVRLKNRPADISERTEGGDFDFPRAKAGGLNAAFMSIYTPAGLQDEEGASFEWADDLIAMMQQIVRDHPDKFAIAATTADVEEQFERGVISFPLGMENGSPIEEDLINLEYFYALGIRYITLTHGKNNQICDSSYDSERKWNGLSPFGREVVREMNRLGIMIDVSHVSDEAFYQVMEISEVPVIASHSSCRHFTPGFERNMDDDMIRKLAENGGVIQINFGSSFISDESRRRLSENRDAIEKHLEENELVWGDPQAQLYAQKYMQENPAPLADVSDVADHIEHVIRIAGIDAVGLGSDYDGVGDTLPTGLKDVSTYPNLFRVLLERGLSEEDLAKIAGGNLMRVWKAVEEHAARQAGAS